MINLLPQQAKNELRLEFVQKRISILLFCIMLGFGFFCANFVILKQALMSKQKTLEVVIQEKQQVFKNAYAQDFKTVIEESSKQIEAGHRLWKEQIFLEPFFEKIAPLVPNNIYFTNLSVKKITQQVPRGEVGEKAYANRSPGEYFFDITLSGFAPTREELFYFNQNLQKESSFQNANFTLSSWVNPDNIDFSMKLEFPASSLAK